MSFGSAFMQCPRGAFGKPAPRLGLASRGDAAFTRADVFQAFDRGVRFVNVPGLSEGDGHFDAVSEAIATCGSLREELVVCAQFDARHASGAHAELSGLLAALHLAYIDVLTLYYVERMAEWEEICGPGGAMEVLTEAKREGRVRRIGVTSHQRPLAAALAGSGAVDTVMIRYNAAHRGAEREVFPVAQGRDVPVIAYTATRWRRLLEATPDDPPGFEPPRAPDWYRFVLQHPAVSVVVAAPRTAEELREDLRVLDVAEPLDDESYAHLAHHGARVRKHAAHFP